MALPIRPGQGLPTNRPVPKTTPVEDTALPSLPGLPALPEVVPNSTQRENSASPKVTKKDASTPPPVSRPAKPRAVAPSEKELPEDPNWRVDPATGKRYKRIAGYKDGVMKSKAAVASVAKGKISLEQLRMMVNEEPDFNLDDLNGSAETFLSHLRVPPNKEEQQKLLEERAARQKQYDEQASRAAAAEAAEEDSLS